MEIIKIFIIPLILAVTLLQGDAQELPIENPNKPEDRVPATLTFYRTDGNSQYVAVSSKLSDTSEDEDWQDFFSDASTVDVIACVTGIWRFFPSTNYHVTPEATGYILGKSDKSSCYFIGQNGAVFLDLLSYRGLGGDDVNWDAIHFFTEDYGGGETMSFYAPFTGIPDELIPNIPNQVFVTRSFLITGKQPADPDPVNTPVYRIIFDPLGDAREGSVCFVLNKETVEGKVSRMHFQERMYYVDDSDGGVNSLFMGSLQHFTLNNMIEDDCKVNSTVGQKRLESPRSVATFPLIGA